MKRKFVDINHYESRNMSKDGNIDFRFWVDKTNEEKLSGAERMIEVVYQDPLFIKTKVDK